MEEIEVLFDEEEEEFRSCCGDDEEEEEEVWKETEEIKEEDVVVDEFSVNLFFKGVSIAVPGDCDSGLSGLGVVMERLSPLLPVIQVQKKLDCYVADQYVVDYLALIDALDEALHSKIRCVYAFTDSQLLYDQIVHEEKLDNPILMALKQRVVEHIGELEIFVLKVVPSVNVERPLKLAQVAIGVVSCPAEGSSFLENCSICCEDKPSEMMLTMECSHKFCSHCMRTYVDVKVQASQVPIRCPQLRCKYFVSTRECQSFLPLTSYESLERALAEANILHSDRIYCPFPNCSALLDTRECLSAKASSSSQTDNSCAECLVCQRFICVECGVPWHTLMTCEQYQNLPLEERDAADITLHRLAQNKRWRRCQQCRRMIELIQGCYHMTCWCGHEFCYSCGAEYTDGQKTCECAFWDEENSEDLTIQSVQESEQWAWETFNSLPLIMDAYSDQERSQLALIQRFLAGGFSLSDHHPHQQSQPPCTDSYVDAMKDIHHLPWLERFVSVISDNYYDEFV